jgi:hypothetical protein
MALPAEPLGNQQGGGNGHKTPELKLRMSEQVGAGVYANSMLVSHSPTEFILDFALITGGAGQVVARVITSPPHMKRVLAALEDNIRKYEAQFGPIKLPAAEEH